VALVSVVGGAGAVVSVALAAAAGRPEVVPAIGLALSWYLAGWVATRARPDHPEALLLQAVGALHLGAFGFSAVAAAATFGRWLPWLAEALAGVLFTAGFAALALVLALYPDGRPRRRMQRLFVGAVGVLAAVAAIAPPLTSTALEPVLALGPDARRSPPGLPLLRWDVDPASVLPPVLVVAGVAALVVARRRDRAREPAVYSWPAGAGALLALLLLATPAAVRLLGAVAWALVFVLAAAAVPWALLAGLTRYRLLAVDLQVTRTLARAALAVLVISCYGVLAALLDDAASPAVAAGVAVVAALTGERLRRWLEAIADRLVTGGRVRRAAAEAELRHTGVPMEGGELAGQVVRTVARALEVSFVNLVHDGRVEASAGTPGAEPPEIYVPVVSGGRVLGSVECGPRHGGWGPEQVRSVEEVAERVGLLWDNARLSSALADRVADLEASRHRLVAAEEEARRRLERDLHDGVQQQIVALLVRLELLRALVAPGTRQAEVTTAAHDLARGALGELRELARGIRPPVLADHGLVAALESRVAQLPVAVTVEADPRIDGTRFPAEVESAAYFVALEALTNVIKHAGGSGARVVLAPGADGLTVAVSDEGRGFADLPEGTGLTGMRDRVEAVGGSLSVISDVGVGTTVTAHLPAEVTSRA
jgi:signal transduction histidine kinase